MFFNDPNEVRLPPEYVRLRNVQVITHPKGDRARVRVELTPFSKRPNVRVSITDEAGKAIAQTDILETMQSNLEFTMHLRGAEIGREYTVEAQVYYQKIPVPSEIPMDIHLPDPMVVDLRKVTFTLPPLEA